MPISQRAVITAVTILSISCRVLGESEDSSYGGACTSATDVYGCVDITGRVATLSGVAIEGADVGPTAGSNTHGLEAKFVNTGQDGVYELRLFQRDATAPASFQLSLKATQRNNAGAEVRSRTMVIDVTPSLPDDYPDPVVLNFVIQ